MQALEVSQLTGDYARLDSYLEGLRRERFPASDELELVDALEELLFLFLNFDLEPEMLHRFASTYDTAAKHVYGVPRSPLSCRLSCHLSWLNRRAGRAGCAWAISPATCATT